MADQKQVTDKPLSTDNILNQRKKLIQRFLDAMSEAEPVEKIRKCLAETGRCIVTPHDLDPRLPCVHNAFSQWLRKQGLENFDLLVVHDTANNKHVTDFKIVLHNDKSE